MGVKRVPLDVVRAWVERTCAAQGVAVKVRDPLVTAAVVTLLGGKRQKRQTGSTRSGSKVVRPRTAGRMIARSNNAATIAR
jgi:hypothetical protein